MSGTGKPGKFPAKVLALAGKLVTLDAQSEEDVEYLDPFVGKVVTVEITPTSGPDSIGGLGGAPGGQSRGRSAS